MDIKTRLSRALDYSNAEFSVEEYLERIKKKEIHLLEIATCLVLFEVNQYPGKRVLTVLALEGESFNKNGPEVIDVMKKLAATLNCSELVCYGRKGWERVLRPYGAVHQYTVMKLEL